MSRSTNLFSRNHPIFFFIKQRRSTDAPGGFLPKKIFRKSFTIFTRKNLFLKRKMYYPFKWIQLIE